MTPSVLSNIHCCDEMGFFHFSFENWWGPLVMNLKAWVEMPVKKDAAILVLSLAIENLDVVEKDNLTNVTSSARRASNKAQATLSAPNFEQEMRTSCCARFHPLILSTFSSLHSRISSSRAGRILMMYPGSWTGLVNLHGMLKTSRKLLQRPPQLLEGWSHPRERLAKKFQLRDGKAERPRVKVEDVEGGRLIPVQSRSALFFAVLLLYLLVFHVSHGAEPRRVSLLQAWPCPHPPRSDLIEAVELVKSLEISSKQFMFKHQGSTTLLKIEDTQILATVEDVGELLQNKW